MAWIFISTSEHHTAWCGSVPSGVAGYGLAWSGGARHGFWNNSPRGWARHGWVRQGVARHGFLSHSQITKHHTAGPGEARLGGAGRGGAGHGMDFQMKRTGHTSAHRGKAVVVYMRDGRHIHGVYSEGRGRFIVLTDGRKILKSEMRCVTIDKEQSRHGKAPRGTAGPG